VNHATGWHVSHATGLIRTESKGAERIGGKRADPEQRRAAVERLGQLRESGTLTTALTAACDRGQVAPGDEAPELIEQRFAANLRVVREERGISQRSLAEEMAARGWPWRQQTVTRVETGRRMVRLGEAQAIAEILETSLDMLMMGTGEARIIEHLANLIRKARESHRMIAVATTELLRARELLRTNAVVAGGGDGESSQVLQMVAEARDVQHLTPEGAVAQGIAQAADVKESLCRPCSPRRGRTTARSGPT
jgi:transcriptional regulator with XRE-family HTH domain